MSALPLALNLMARYRAVLQASWSLRKELAGPHRLADEAAFLPAAMSLQVTPPHPAPRRTLWLLMALIAAAVAWSLLGQVDIVATAPGRIVVSQRSKTIQPLEPGVVQAIHVHDGSHVRAGDVLIELDATAAGADSRSASEQAESARAEERRAQELLRMLAAGPGTGQHGLEAEPSLQGDVQLQAEWADIRARTARLDAEAHHRDAEIETHEQALVKLRSTLPLVQQREADFLALQAQGFVAGHAGQDRARERLEMERDLATQQAKVAEARAALDESRQTRAAYLAEIRRTLQDRAAEARLKARSLAEQTAKADQRQRLTRLTAPVSGTVQQLAVHTEGGVVTEAQALMVIVPDDDQISAEVMLDNKDIGFVHAGQAAQIKIETFSFTRYGTVPATVQRVSADAVQDDKRGAVFTATLLLRQQQIQIDGRAVPLSPGMNLSVEIQTGRRRVIDFLLAPVQATVQNSLKER